MGYFAEQLDAYAARFGLSARDRRRIAMRWPLFKLFYWARSGSPATRAAAMPAFRLFRNHRVRHTLNGASGPIEFDLSFDEFEFATFREVLWGREYDAPIDLFAARTLVDLGANTGLATIRFMLSAPLEQVVCVEANPALVPALRERLAGRRGVTVEHAAVVGRPEAGTVPFTVSPNPRHGSANPIAGTTIHVPAVRLRDLLDRHGMRTVDILKVDIEGSEHDLLDDDADAFDRARVVFVEVHGSEAVREAFVARLTKQGFDIASRTSEQNAVSESVVATRRI